MALNEAIEEIRNNRGTIIPQEEAKPSPKKREKRPMTKAEIEAYRQRKMREEEERYLGKPARKKARSGNTKKPSKKAQSAKPKKSAKAEGIRKTKMRSCLFEPPLEPLCIIRLPGHSKDQVALCLLRG